MTDLSLYYQTFMTSGCLNNQMGNQKGLGLISYYLDKCANALKLQTTPGSTLNALPYSVQGSSSVFNFQHTFRKTKPEKQEYYF